MKEAKFYKLQDDKEKLVQCLLCPRECKIADGHEGTCKVRKNIDGKLYAMTYAKPVSLAIDPIEKKPLFHFLPGEGILSFGTLGCNLKCDFCQNADISTAKHDDYKLKEVMPQDIVDSAIEHSLNMIAYTYNEPTVFYEYVYDTAILAKKQGLKNVLVSNGYINKKPFEELAPFIDGINIDLKAFTKEFYTKRTKSNLEKVKETIILAKKLGCWLELTTLLIPGENDSKEEIEKLVMWVKDNVGEVPLHFSRFFPQHKLTEKEVTPLQSLLVARDVAREHLSFVYIGNVITDDGENTFCPKCNKLLVERSARSILQNNIKNSKCKFCSTHIPGVWE